MNSVVRNIYLKMVIFRRVIKLKITILGFVLSATKFLRRSSGGYEGQTLKTPGTLNLFIGNT